MKFEEFVMKQNREVYQRHLNPSGTEENEKRNVSNWQVYQTIETNKKLVRATWVLAITTIVLSIITLLFK